MRASFWAQVVREGHCWVWTGARNRHGYGRSRRLGQNLAHRVAWTMLRGPIPDGSHVLHACDNPPCVNPAHLFLGTHADNMADMIAKGRDRHPLGTKARPEPICAHVHDLTVHGGPHRNRNGRTYIYCRACHRAQESARRLRNTALAEAWPR